MDIRNAVGRTPLVYLRRVSRIRCCSIYVKHEAGNASGSAASRSAGALVAAALEDGRLQRGGCVVDACMPNMAMALAMECSQMDVRVIAVMPDDVNPALLPVLHAMGGEIMLTPAADGFEGAMLRAEEIRKEIWTSCTLGMPGSEIAAKALDEGLGAEICADCAAEGVVPDAFVACVGTGAVMAGAGGRLKREFGTRLVAVSAAPGERGLTGLEGLSLPRSPAVDETVEVSLADAAQGARRLVNMEAVCGGLSAGACLHAAIQLSVRPEWRGKTIVVMGYDSGERYGHREIYGAPSPEILLNSLPERAWHA